MQPHVIHSPSKSFSPFQKKGYFWRISSFFNITDYLYLLESTTLSYVQYTDHRITIHQQSYSTVPLMESEDRALMPKSFEILKKDLPLLVTINLKAFPPLQPRINSIKT